MVFKNLFIKIKENINLLILLFILLLVYVSNNKNIIKNENFVNNNNVTKETGSNNNVTKEPQRSCDELLDIEAVQKRVHSSILSTPCRWDNTQSNAKKIIQNFNIYVNIKLPLDNNSEPQVFRYALTMMKYDKFASRIHQSNAHWNNNHLDWTYKKGKSVQNDHIIPTKNDLLLSQDTCCNLIQKKMGANDIIEECQEYIPVLERIKTELGLKDGKPAFEIPHNNITLFTTTQKIERQSNGECAYLNYAKNEFPVNIRFNKHNPNDKNMFLKMDDCKGRCSPSLWGNNVEGQMKMEEGKKEIYKNIEPACVKTATSSKITPKMKMCIELIKKDNQKLYKIQFKDDVTKEKYYLLPDINKLGQIGNTIGCPHKSKKHFNNQGKPINPIDCTAPNTQFGDRLDIIPLVFVKDPYGDNNALKDKYNNNKYQIKQGETVYDNFMDLLYEFKPQECKRETRSKTTTRGSRRQKKK
jgi:hypothetical protein